MTFTGSTTPGWLRDNIADLRERRGDEELSGKLDAHALELGQFGRSRFNWGFDAGVEGFDAPVEQRSFGQKNQSVAVGR